MTDDWAERFRGAYRARTRVARSSGHPSRAPDHRPTTATPTTLSSTRALAALASGRAQRVRQRPKAPSASRLRDRHPHAVADLRGTSGPARRTRNWWPGFPRRSGRDGCAPSRPVRAGTDITTLIRSETSSPVDLRSSCSSRMRSLAQPSASSSGGHRAVQHHQPGAVGQRRGVLRVGGDQPRAVLLGLQHRRARGQRAVRVDDALAGLDRLDRRLHVLAQPRPGDPGVDGQLEPAVGGRCRRSARPS